MQLAASLDDRDAVLCFPYDEHLRQLLRAIPGRRWDPVERVWRVPLQPDCAEALGRLLSSLQQPPAVSAQLERALTRARARRDTPRRCLLELARPDERWWLSFATDAPASIVSRLLEHPHAYQMPTIGRALLPVDEHAARIIGELQRGSEAIELSANAEHALQELAGREQPPPDPPAHELSLARDRRGAPWILIGEPHAPAARALAAGFGLEARDGPAGSVGVPANPQHAPAIAQLIAALEASSIDPRIERWVERSTSWHGVIEVAGPPAAPAFLLLGDPQRLPGELRARSRAQSGGVSVPMTLDHWRLVEKLDGVVSPPAARCARALIEGREPPHAVLELSCIHDEPTFVLAAGHQPQLLERFAELQGAVDTRAARGSEHEHARLPAIRADPFCVPQLDRLLAEHQVSVDPDAHATLVDIRERHAHGAGLVELSAALAAPLEVDGLGGQLKSFQRAGVSYLLSQRRAFLADEQGLGKTVQALAALQADAAFPAIVLCPAALKLNWMREIERWLPSRSAQALNGAATKSPLEGADITVVNYDILAARLGELTGLRARALVLDESHYCKNATAKRTLAAQRLADAIGPDGLRLALTGTPVMNRPAELIPQLRILGRLEEFGSGAQFGRCFRGPDAHMRLHWHLRSRCFARRLKSDVLTQLPAKQRSIVPLELDNQAEYRLAERDLVAWLRSQPLDLRELDAKVASALRAERLVRLNALKLLAARGKLPGALTWIHDFLCSGERLVLFAHHREIHRAVLERFPEALHIIGQDSPRARDEALRAFQDPDGDHRLIVCSAAVASEGITLTRASNVAFLELDWTPAKHEQAEDRCHRIGQQDAVNAWYLLAADTVDETIAALLERKRAVIGAVVDGREQDEDGVLDALVRDLRGERWRHLRAVA
jgi:SWI/SNF-related matrix-associated actin-dependent regulator 1 of chromatin subfamily A